MACITFKDKSCILYRAELQGFDVCRKMVLGKTGLDIIFLDTGVGYFYSRGTCFSEAETSFCGCFIIPAQSKCSGET